MNKEDMQKLIKEHASSRIKMILGIVFSVAALQTGFVAMTAVTQFYSYYISFFEIVIWGIVGFFFSMASVGLLAAGIPLLIVGILGMTKTSRRISKAKRASNVVAYSQPAWQPAPQNSVAPPQPVRYQTNVQPERNAVPTGNTVLDWRKYSPLDAGVTYIPEKDYKFHRADGFVGSVPQNFVNRTFPKCPICCSKEPYWTIAQHVQMSWKGNLYLFKCSCCESIISMSMPDVTTLSNGASGVVANPNVGLTNMVVKASSGKEAGAIYAVVESVGRSGVDPVLAGKEFKLEDLQDMYLR